MKARIPKLEKRLWGVHAGEEVVLIKLTNDSGACVEVTNYGATLVSIVVPDRFDKKENVILGFPTLKGYTSDTCYIGSTVGRFANRIGGAKFTLDGATYQLDKNDGNNCNHGGRDGFNSKVFSFEIKDTEVVFSLSSPHMEGGFPGSLEVKISYQWTDANELFIRYNATSDRKTVLNLTNHAYFNLSPGRDIFEHALTIRSSKILQTREDYVPTGKIIPAGDNSFQNNTVYQRSTVKDGGITGLNTFYVFDPLNEEGSPVCTLSEQSSGRVLEVFTSYPGVQLYTGDFLTSAEMNNLSSFHKPFDGLCLECQYFPDSPNHKDFPSTVINAGDVYDEQIVYKFSTRK